MQTGANLNCLSAEELAAKDAEFPDTGEAIPPVKDVELVLAHASQDGVVDLPHDLGGAESLEVGSSA